MRTLSSLAAVLAVTLIISTPASAQRSGARSAATSHAAATSCIYQGCAEDYSLNVVSALFPYTDGQVTGPPMVTLVIENSGSIQSPSSVVAVAPRDKVSLASRWTIPALNPGERTVVQVPVVMGPDGTPCIAVTISQGLSPSVTDAVRFASARD